MGQTHGRLYGTREIAVLGGFVRRPIDCSLPFCRLGIVLCSELAGMMSDVLDGLPLQLHPEAVPSPATRTRKRPTPRFIVLLAHCS
jgi:hypothetical protein